MNKEELLEEALRIAIVAHECQKDKGGHPYIFHPLRVSMSCNTMDEKIVALLHDVVEDSNVTIIDLGKRGFPAYILEALLSVTRKEQETYEEFIKRASKNKIGRIVKIKDLEDNMNLTRLNTEVLSEKDLQRMNRYIKSYKFLTKQND